MKSWISRSAAWHFTTAEENPDEVVAARRQDRGCDKRYWQAVKAVRSGDAPTDEKRVAANPRS